MQNVKKSIYVYIFIVKYTQQLSGEDIVNHSYKL